ncbi:hypothetical protein [Parabacteroides sp. AM58-2XD]|uniref:hypothetical protein n=1 Tax=Parabacteroides sp. AM58-2XD TaxID=2292362 RepID=UPI001F1AF1BC|nr:hypothetical protein [Parabacteroides sp. AM58-2XD]
MRVAYCLLSVCLLASCSSVSYVGIDTYNPAEITFPKSVGKILVVNNAVPQPDDVGCEFNLFGDKVDTCKVKADSALFDVCRGLAGRWQICPILMTFFSITMLSAKMMFITRIKN